jgi:hypothetical protein
VRAREISRTNEVSAKVDDDLGIGRVEHRMAEFDGEADLEPVEGLEAHLLVALLDLHALHDPQVALLRRLLLDPRRLQQEDEGAGAAVHDRHFLGRYVDEGVVDAQARERRHEVLDGGDARAVLLEHRGERRVGHEIGARRDGRIAGQVRAAEDNAGVDGRGTQPHRDLVAGMESDPRGADGRLEGSLAKHYSPILSRI